MKSQLWTSFEFDTKLVTAKDGGKLFGIIYRNTLWHDIDVHVCGVLLGAHKFIESCYRIYRCVLIAAVTTIIDLRLQAAQ